MKPSTRRRNQRKRCRRKIAYRTAGLASIAARQQEARFGKRMYVYPCWANGGRQHFHTASMPTAEVSDA